MSAKRRKTFIVHVDMDAFFAAIEQRDDPRLRGKPVIVGSDPKAGRGRGVVSTCSYEARKFGVHSAMPISIAYRKCPQAVFLPVDMEKYEEASRQIYGIFYAFTPDIEPISIDEAFLDISSTYHLFGPPLEACQMLKKRIRDETALTASVGLAPTKMAAKIASDLGKPDGLTEISEEGLLDFLWPLDVRRIWGLGEKCAQVLNGVGIRTIGDLARQDLRCMVNILGKNGARFWRLANGVDDTAVSAGTKAQSVSNEATFSEDTRDDAKVEACLMRLCDKVCARLRRDGFKCRTVTMKIRLENFHTFTRSITIDRPTNFTVVLYKACKELYNNFNKRTNGVRLIGVKASNLCPPGAGRDLFMDLLDRKTEGVDGAVDKIRTRFGDGSIYRASSV